MARIEAGVTDNKAAMPDEKILKHSHDADAAMQAFEGLDGETIVLTEEERKRLLRKIDWHLMPVRAPWSISPNLRLLVGIRLLS